MYWYAIYIYIYIYTDTKDRYEEKSVTIYPHPPPPWSHLTDNRVTSSLFNVVHDNQMQNAYGQNLT